jgi:hypothetical protein
LLEDRGKSGKLVSRWPVAGPETCEREKRKMMRGCSERHWIRKTNIFYGFEGSQIMPARVSGKGMFERR